MKIIHSGFILIMILGLGLFGACTTQKTVDVPRENMRKQMALQRHLRKLNSENDKLLKILKKSSVLNIETAESMDQTAINEGTTSKLNEALQAYMIVNKDTQIALDAFEKAIKDDSEKNDYIDSQLDGFSVECRSQQDRLGKIRDGMYEQATDQWISDNVHVGISSQMFQGGGSFGADELLFSGLSKTAYFTYVGAYDTSIGFKYMTIDGRIESKDSADDDSDYTANESTIGLFSLGFRIPTVDTFNIIPELLYGMGNGKFRSCTSSGCNDDLYLKSEIRVVGFEIPFYHNLSSFFSWGFKFSGYRIEADRYDIIYDDSNLGTVHTGIMETFLGAGLMVGLAW